MNGIGFNPNLPAPAERQTTLPAHEEARLRRAASDFESIFIKQMLSSMRKAIPKDPEGGLIKESQGEKIFRDMLDGEYADLMSQSGSGMGLGDMLFQQLVSRHRLKPEENQVAQEATEGLDTLKRQASQVQARHYGIPGK